MDLLIKFQIGLWFKGQKVIMCTCTCTHTHTHTNISYVFWEFSKFSRTFFILKVIKYILLLGHFIPGLCIIVHPSGCFIICQFFWSKVANVVYYLHMFISFHTAEKLEMEHGIPGLCHLRNRHVLNRTRPILLEVMFYIAWL